MLASEKSKNIIILILIILSGSLLRLWNYTEIPFTHDEFSALFRLHFNNFHELIEKGVKPDGHPAGIQVFLYFWTKLFGFSEPVFKLPFVVMGILSIWILYLLGKNWFNETVGLISSAFFASIQFAIMNSQTARPYSSGLFFCLIMLYFWTKVVFKPEKNLVKNSVFFIIASSFCAYNHYFSLLFALIVGFIGLAFVQKRYRIFYILSGLIIFILFIPHFEIFIAQVNIGGISGWLNKPKPGFILDFISYIFQYSAFSSILVLLIVILGFHKYNWNQLNKKFIILSFALFFVPFLVGYFYSIFVNSVLHFNVLFFSFPFLFFILFGHLKLQKPLINLVLVLAILAVNISVLIVQRQHYQLFYNSPYLGILNDYQNFKRKETKIISIIDSNHKISDYYVSKYQIDTGFVLFDDLKSEKRLIQYLSENYSSSDKVFFGCLSGSNAVIVPIIMDFYPKIEWQKNYSGATCYIFSKSDTIKESRIGSLDFETNTSSFSNLDLNKIILLDSLNSNNTYLLDSLNEWSPTFSKKLDKVIENGNNFIDISVKVNKPNKLCEAVLVASINKGEQPVHWDGKGFRFYIDSLYQQNDWISIYHSIKLSDIDLNYNNLELKVYVWNKGKENLIIDDIKIVLRSGNPLIYGLFERF